MTNKAGNQSTEILYERRFLTHSLWNWDTQTFIPVYPAGRIAITITREQSDKRCCYYSVIHKESVCQRWLITCGRNLEELKARLQEIANRRPECRNLLNLIFYTIKEYEQMT
ncbi:MAG: hypothetical protein DRN49_00035 [Thaumarchaeota archaeon]|nr:MAG: hypothetical protein DRN49_00035 [Nitrososphaerota archaeon]